MEPNLFLTLAEKYVAGTASEDEREVVETYWELLSDGDPANLDQAALKRIKAEISANVLASIGEIKLTPVRKIRWVRYAAAAVILFAIATTWFIYNNDKKLQVTLTAQADVPAPASNRAMITLGNGRTVYLDSASNGQLASLGSVQLVKLSDGQIAYSGNTGAVSYNTLSNPRGSKVIDMQLTDGSHVWLNAGSSITYPVPMSGKTRDVTIQGEAYFEVAKDPARPFTVSKGEAKVTVLGTHFNVNAYQDEANIKVTLLEGSVRLTQKAEGVTLKPGEQAVAGENIQVISGIDTDDVMAWKNGLFHFDRTDIETVMRQIARWYDVEIVYESKPEKLFAGGAPRSMSAANVFKALEETGGVHFTIEGNKVIVRK